MKCFSDKKTKATIGLITPSAPAPGLFPERFQRGEKGLENIGFVAQNGLFTLGVEGVVAATAINRALDINNFFLDDDIFLLMATIGGDYCAEVLPYLNWEAIRAHPKGIIGYSDITILLQAIGIKGQQVVFYGPTLMTEFSEFPKPPQISQNYFLDLFNCESSLKITPCDLLLSKGVDWSLDPRERGLSCVVSHKTIRGGKCSGVVLGGCIESLQRLRGTEFWPNLKDSIFIIETAEEQFNVKNWRCLVADYINMGVFEEISGLVIGQKMWNDKEIEQLAAILIVATSHKQIPILYGLPFGHISPIASFPLFTRATLNADCMTLEYNKPFRYEYVGSL